VKAKDAETNCYWIKKQTESLSHSIS